MARLTDKQKRFAGEYLVDLNATQAAIRAGYSKRTACEQGSRLLANVKVRQEIRRRQERLQDKLEITQERVLEELAAVAFARGTDYTRIDAGGRVVLTPTDRLTAGQQAAVTSIRETQAGVEVRLADKVRALELLGKHLGVFADRVAVSGVSSVQIIDDLPEQPAVPAMGLEGCPAGEEAKK